MCDAGSRPSRGRVVKVRVEAPTIKAFLRVANLSGAILRDTGLPGVDLWNANLSGADLTGARVSEEQLELCESLAGTTMPDGSKHD